MIYQEPKLKITRSFSRKINTGNYENIDIMASYTEAVFDDNYTEVQVQALSEGLYRRAKQDVENAVIEFGNERVKRQEGDLEQKAEAELNLGLDLQDEEDRSNKLKKVNKALGLK